MSASFISCTVIFFIFLLSVFFSSLVTLYYWYLLLYYISSILFIILYIVILLYIICYIIYYLYCWFYFTTDYSSSCSWVRAGFTDAHRGNLSRHQLLFHTIIADGPDCGWLSINWVLMIIRDAYVLWFVWYNVIKVEILPCWL